VSDQFAIKTLTPDFALVKKQCKTEGEIKLKVGKSPCKGAENSENRNKKKSRQRRDLKKFIEGLNQSLINH
jgi:hypothetical protein